MLIRSNLALGALLLVAAATTACDKEEERTVKPVAETERPRRAAIGFVRCVEQTGGECVEPVDGVAGWNAFSILGWLGQGSPPAILRMLPDQLQKHASTRVTQRRFVARMNDMREPLRGAECTAARINPLSEMIGPLRSAVQTRLTTVGLWNADFETLVGRLAEQASSSLATGYLVEMSCQDTPYSFYVATSDESGRQVPVGVLDALPPFLGGEAPGRDHVEGRMRAIEGEISRVPTQDSFVGPWMPFSMEVL